MWTRAGAPVFAGQPLITRSDYGVAPGGQLSILRRYV